jgi:hypothetical protein
VVSKRTTTTKENRNQHGFVMVRNITRPVKQIQTLDMLAPKAFQCGEHARRCWTLIQEESAIAATV